MPLITGLGSKLPLSITAPGTDLTDSMTYISYYTFHVISVFLIATNSVIMDGLYFIFVSQLTIQLDFIIKFGQQSVENIISKEFYLKHLKLLYFVRKFSKIYKELNVYFRYHLVVFVCVELYLLTAMVSTNK